MWLFEEIGNSSISKKGSYFISMFNDTHFFLYKIYFWCTTKLILVTISLNNPISELWFKKWKWTMDMTSEIYMCLFIKNMMLNIGYVNRKQYIKKVESLATKRYMIFKQCLYTYSGTYSTYRWILPQSVFNCLLLLFIHWQQTSKKTILYLICCCSIFMSHTKNSKINHSNLDYFH